MKQLFAATGAAVARLSTDGEAWNVMLTWKDRNAQCLAPNICLSVLWILRLDGLAAQQEITGPLPEGWR